MSQIIIDDIETIAVVMKPVGTNGQISIGTEFSGIPIIAYVIRDRRNYTVDDQNSKNRKKNKDVKIWE